MKRRTLLAAAVASTAIARAQTPALPQVVTLMVPFPVGGASDGFARVIGPRLAKALNCTVIVENMAGASGSLAGENLAESSGVAMSHVPYKGGAPLLQDLMGGHLDMVVFPADGNMAKQTAGGKVKVLAVTGPARSAAFPSVPTFAESKLLAKYSTVDVWGGVFIPAAAPAALTEAMYRAVQAALADPEAQQQLQALAGVPLMPAMSMAQAAQFYEAEIKSYRQAVTKAKLQPS